MSSTDTYGSGGTDGEDGASSGDDWLSDAKNYDGTVTDLTGKKSVTVDVGPEDHPYAFTPPAIRISPGTTVVWKWRGGGYHNVVAKNGQFDSGEPEQNATFEYTFETAGTVAYYCDPHKSMGMKGAVIVTGSGTNGSNETADNTSKETTHA